MNKPKSFYENIIIKVLISKPFKKFSYALSHGGSHLVIFIVVFYLTYQWANININSAETSFHNFNIGIETPDTLSSLTYTFTIDSDSLLKKSNNKYNSEIRISFSYDFSNDISHIKDTTKIKLYTDINLSDALVYQDSTYLAQIGDDTIRLSKTSYSLRPKFHEHTYKTHCTYNYKDSTIIINVVPARNSPTPGGKLIAGDQDINICSKKIGITEQESPWETKGYDYINTLWKKLGLTLNTPYYNYYIGLGHLPDIKSPIQYYPHTQIYIEFGDLTIKNGYFHSLDKKILYQYIYPEPDILNNAFIAYTTEESISKVAKNHGIIIQAVDIDAQNKNSRKSIIYSVLVGTGAAFIIDILIQLIRELRNLNRRKEQEEEEEMLKNIENNKNYTEEQKEASITTTQNTSTDNRTNNQKARIKECRKKRKSISKRK